ncbi:MAG: tRNA uridine-5-carboxymethylaminomethyl(34) synthesis GTPase MnmE [Trichlorobacter sp.]|jgi:tRNA modification GTPase
MYVADTIAAIATPPGCGGIGIVRISGPQAEQIGTSIFLGKSGGGFDSHRLYYGHFIDPADASMIDEGMAVLMRAPRSYTREDVLELHSHGGYLVVRRVLHACVVAGARLADPGEFTRRAFLNGRIDLCQAESVLDLINSRTDAALSLAQRQREGLLGRELEVVRRLTAEALAIVEAHIDFPDEEIDSASLMLVTERITSARQLLVRLVDSFRLGKVLREGVSVVLAGKPNAGKSSLLNALACEERAIVSAIPGTTRDMIEEIVTIEGLPVRIVDAAGIRRHFADEIEQEGIRRTLGMLAEADLVLFLADGSHPLDADDLEILSALAGKPFVTVITKSDLPQLLDRSALPVCLAQVSVSSRSGFGLDELRSALYSYFMQDAPQLSDDLVAISNTRHRDVLTRTLSALDLYSMHGEQCFSPDLLAIDLRESLSALGELTGETTPEAVLDLIFSTFCIGK